MSQYDDSHRLFVQAMLTKRIISEESAKSLYNTVCRTTHCQPKEYQVFIGEINKELDLLDFSLKVAHAESDGTSYLAFVNGKGDFFTEGATRFKPAEISYCRELFERIVTADNEDYAISAMKAVRLGNSLSTKLTQRETQEVLDQLIEDKWIALEQKGVYYMDTRAITELQSYFREEYGDAIQECTFCLDIITMGERCRTNNCPVRLHKYCANSQVGSSSNPVCPQCAVSWDRDNTFGLGLPSDGDEVLEDMSEEEEEQ